MGKTFLKETAKLLQEKRRRKRWYRTVISLSLVVALVTTCLLIHPAITMERTPSCGVEEHTHTQECYEHQLICGQEEREAIPATEETVLNCPLAVHEHTDECYDEEGQLICGSEAHAHDDSCYQTVYTEGIEGHTHTDACYQDVLVCQKTEHTHSESCYPPETEAPVPETSAPETTAPETTAPETSAPETTAPETSAPETTTPETEAPVTTEAPATEENVTEAPATEAVTEPVTEKTTEASVAPEACVLTANGIDYTVQVDCSAAAQIPKNATLSVRELKAETTPQEYTAYYQQAEAKVQQQTGKTILYGRLFDIAILVNGTEIQPAVPVTVKITYTSVVQNPEGSEVKAVYFGNVTELLNVRTNEYNRVWSEVTIDAKGLSVFAIGGIGTVQAESEEVETETEEIETEETETESIEALAEVPTELSEQEMEQPATETEVETETEQPETETEVETETEQPATETELETEQVTETETETDTEESEEFMTEEISTEETVTEESETEEVTTEETETEETTVEETETEEAVTEEPATEEPVTEEPITEEPTTEETTEEESETEETTEDTAADEPHILTAEGSDYTVQVSYTAEAQIPEDAVLSVREIEQGTEEYNTYYQQAMTAVQESDTTTISFARFFDISFLVDGKEIEPAAPVSVKISYADAVEVPEEGDVKSVHFGDEAEVLDVQTNENGGTLDEVTFDAESFSVYGIVGTETVKAEFLSADGNTYEVIVDIRNATNIPSSAVLIVEDVTEENYEEYATRAAEALKTDPDSFTYVKLLDISIFDNGKEIQPNGSVTVDIKIKDQPADSDFQVVHFGEETEVLDPATEGDTVQFNTDGFSIYAIVNTTKRLVYKFYNGNTLLSTQYIKTYTNSSNVTLCEELYDPGLVVEYGQMFVGWSFDANADPNSSDIYTMTNLKAYAKQELESGNFSDLEERKVYAIFTEAYYLRYMIIDDDGNATVWHTESVAKDDTAHQSFTVINGPSLEVGQEFRGWLDGSTGYVYTVGESITLNKNIDLYVKIDGRYWLVFDANTGNLSSSGVTYTPPQLIYGEGVVTKKPEDLIWKGYTFIGWNTAADGSGTWWYKADGTVNSFGNTLSKDVILYAQWEADDTDYYVIFWKQKATDSVGLSNSEKSYDYVSSSKRTAKTGTLVNIITADSGTTADNRKGGFTGSEYGFYFTYNSVNSDTDGKVVSADGTTVLNVYYDRTEITYTFKEAVTTYSQEEFGRYGIVDGQYVQLYYWSGWRYQPVGDSDNHSTVYYLSGRNYQIYDGLRYSLSSSDLTFTGLYGSSFTEWPSAGSGNVWWYGGYNFPLALTEFNPLAAYNGNDPSSFTDTTIAFTKQSYTTSNNKLYIYIQTENGNWSYAEDYLLTTADLTSAGTWYPTETFIGFEVNSYQVGGTLNQDGEWTSVTSTGSIRYSNNIFLRYVRNQHSIHFISQGSGAEGRTEETVSGIYYEAGLSGYGYDTNTDRWYYEPTNALEGHEFVGWYKDEACLIPFDFETEKMPDNDINLYAKWETTCVRTVLVPTVNNEHNAEVSFANNQALTFLLDYNEKVSGTNITGAAAKRTGYRLVDWYYTPDFQSGTNWNFVTQVNKNVNGVDMTYQSSSDWLSNTYGDNDGKHQNVKGILKLYAKWELDVNENAIYIEYEVPEDYLVYSGGVLRTTIPVDTTAYIRQDNGSTQTARIAVAPTNYNTDYEFDQWILLDANGNETETKADAGEMWTIDESCIETRILTDDNGTTKKIQFVRFRAGFNIKSEKATTVTYNGNGGVSTDDGRTLITDSKLINESFTILGTASFTRKGYALVGWSFLDDSDASDFKNKTGVITDSNGEVIGFAPGTEVAADNLTLSAYNTEANTLYAVWEALPWNVTVKQIIQNEEGSTAIFSYGFSGDLTDTFDLIGGTSAKPASWTKETQVNAGTNLTLPTPSNEDYELVCITINGVEYREINAYTVDEDVEIIFTYRPIPRVNVIVKKLAAGSTDTYLNNAVFTLYQAGDPNTLINDSKVNQSLGSDGQFTISDGKTGFVLSLPYGNYKIKETIAPDGYIIASSDTYFTVDSSGIHMTTVNGSPITDATDAEVINDVLIVYNAAGTALPNTGGSGTSPYTLSGLLLIATALMYGFVLRRRRERRISG